MNTMKPRINLLVLRSLDIDSSAKFYSTLGFVFIKHRHGSGPEHYSSENDRVVFELYPATSVDPIRFGLDVENVKAAEDTLLKAGGTSVSRAKSSEWGIRAVVSDLDGHKIELTQPPYIT